MSEHNPIERLALEMAAIRRDLAVMARARGDRLTRAEVCERLGIHRNTLKTYLKERGFPAPSPDGKFLLCEVIEWETR
jgi:transcriptional regulator with XRE-family HTH domain